MGPKAGGRLKAFFFKKINKLIIVSASFKDKLNAKKLGQEATAL